MRIIAGKHKGRRIELGKDNSSDIRPTSDFAREAIFNILAHGKHGLNGHTFEGQRVLDVFCGTGAFGLEALSRGAAEVTFVDQSRDAIAVTRQNAEHLGEIDNVSFLLADATRLARARKPYSLVFLDPPYFSNLIVPTLKCLNVGGWLDRSSLIIIEHDEKENLNMSAEFSVVDERRYGRAMVKVLKLGVT
jgi:16S rRNA (guanine966-N2)-methyltransferase